MRCAYCGVEITDYPDSGICVHCGGKLPTRPQGIRCSSCGSYSTGNFCSICGRNLNSAATPPQPVSVSVQPIYQQVYIPHQSAISCPKCGSFHIVTARRGYSWGLGILGFFLFPVFGLLLGRCGRSKLRGHCAKCGHRWKL